MTHYFYSFNITVTFHLKARETLALRIAFELSVCTITVFFSTPVGMFLLKESRGHVRGEGEEWGIIRKLLERKDRVGTEITPGLICPGNSNVFKHINVYFNTLIK